MTLKPNRILVVDDNSEIHRDFAKILAAAAHSAALEDLDDLEASVFGAAASINAEPTTYAIDFASQGTEALEMVRRAVAEGRPYGMAFVDVRMPPGWDGVRTIAELRRADPLMQFTICTAYSDYTPEEAQRKIGLSDGLLFIIKPFDAEIIRKVADDMSSRPEVRMAG